MTSLWEIMEILIKRKNMKLKNMAGIDKEAFYLSDRKKFFFMPHIIIILALIFFIVKFFEDGFHSNFLGYLLGIFLAFFSTILMHKMKSKCGFILFVLSSVLGFFYYCFFAEELRQNITICFYLLFTIQCIFLLDRPLSMLFSILLFLTYSLSTILFNKKGLRASIEEILLIGVITASIIEAKNWIRTLILAKVDSLKKTQNITFKILGKISDLHDIETSYHLQRVEILVGRLVEYLLKEGIYTKQISKSYLQDIKSAAYLHDIGKVGISDFIINKKGPLTDSEYLQMQKHTVIGYEILKEASNQINDDEIFKLSQEMARHHHEKWNGTGYPDKLVEEMIPLSARIMSIVDVFDALISKRSYKEPFSLKDTKEIINDNSGVSFDPLIARVLIKYSDELYSSVSSLIL